MCSETARKQSSCDRRGERARPLQRKRAQTHPFRERDDFDGKQLAVGARAASVHAAVRALAQHFKQLKGVIDGRCGGGTFGRHHCCGGLRSRWRAAGGPGRQHSALRCTALRHTGGHAKMRPLR